MCDGGWGTHPQQLSNYTHVINRRWDPILVGDMVKIDGFPDGSRLLSPDRSTYSLSLSLSIFNAFLNTAAQVHTDGERKTHHHPLSSKMQRSIAHSMTATPPRSFFFSLSFFMFWFFEFPAQHANALLLPCWRLSVKKLNWTYPLGPFIILFLIPSQDLPID